MTYVPYTWTTGDLITASRLNNLEAGATEALAAAAQADVIFIVNVTGEYDETLGETVYAADKTIAEIWAAYENGKMPYAKYHGDTNSGPLFCIFNNGYYADGEGELTFSGAQWNAELANVAYTSISIYTDDGNEVCYLVGNTYTFPA